jgi:hypothetical protein
MRPPEWEAGSSDLAALQRRRRVTSLFRPGFPSCELTAIPASRVRPSQPRPCQGPAKQPSARPLPSPSLDS